MTAKLVYFPLQGRAQSIRYLLAFKQVAFEDVKLSFEEWGAVKAAGTYGENAQLPVYVDESGKIFNQGNAILQMLAMKHGLGPQNAEEMYEIMWFFETIADHKPDAEYRAVLFTEGAAQESIDKMVEEQIKLLNKFESRWADGRAYCSGANITAADFFNLTAFTSLFNNPNIRNPSLSERVMVHYATLTHVKRVMENIKGQCQATVDALELSWI